MSSHRPSAAVWAGLATIYVIWGSTYLAVDLGIRTIPPLLMMSARHVIAGAILLLWAWRRGALARRPRPREWGAAGVVGGFLFLGGHGSLSWAQQTVPSGVAALVLGTIPLWLALIDRVVYGQRLSAAAIGGLLLGFVGLAVLVGPGEGRVPVVPTLVILGGAISWAAGSLYSREASLPPDPVLTASLSALCGGALLACAGAVGGELDDVRPHSISAESLLGVAYLVAFGSIVAYTVYLWLLRAARTSVVATYAFVNPVVALLLGWALLGERIGTRTALASAAIVAAVALTVAAPVASPAAGQESRRFRGNRERPDPGVQSGEPG